MNERYIKIPMGKFEDGTTWYALQDTFRYPLFVSKIIL